MADKPSSSIKLDELLSASVFLAKKAGAIIRSVYEEGKYKDTVDKRLEGGASQQWEDPQTEADVRAQRLIIASLRKAFPDVLIIGEEGKLENTASDELVPDLTLCAPQRSKIAKEYQDVETKKLCVWVDPLDGTREYALGLIDAVTTLIGFSYEGKAIGGVVHVPFTGHTLWGALGVGVYGDLPVVTAEAVRATARGADQSERRVVVTSRSHMTQAVRDLIERLGVDDILQIGGAGSKGLKLLTGAATAYVFPQNGTKKWDTCAIHAMIEAQGGRFTDSYGGEITYFPEEIFDNTRGVLGTLGCDHQSFVIDQTVLISKV